MIFTWFSRVVLKLGDESHVFDREHIMLPEVVEIEKVSGLSYMEWRVELDRFSMRAVAPLLHVLRKRAGVASDFATMTFDVGDLEVLALRDDGTEMTGAEMIADIERRAAGAQAAAADPTPGAGDRAPDPGPIPATAPTSPASPNGTASAPGNGRSSRGSSSAGSRPTPTGA